MKRKQKQQKCCANHCEKFINGTCCICGRKCKKTHIKCDPCVLKELKEMEDEGIHFW